MGYEERDYFETSLLYYSGFDEHVHIKFINVLTETEEIFPSAKQSKVIFSDLSLPKSPSDLSSKMANKNQKRSKRNKRSSLRRDKRSSLRRNKRSSRYETHSKLS